MTNASKTGASLCDCSDSIPQFAAILYPSLGTPLLIGANQKKFSIFIATGPLGAPSEHGARDTLDKRSTVTPMNGDEDKTAAAVVARQLRLVGMTGSKPSANIKVGELTGDGKDCEVAKSAIKVWKVAKFEAGALIYNQKGEIFATLSPQAVRAYSASGFTGTTVYEIEMELAKLAVQPESGNFKSFVWMVEPTKKQKQDFPTLCAAATVHAQDLLVEAFLSAQVADPKYRHQPANSNGVRRGNEACLVEYDVAQTAKNARTLVANSAQRLAAWHPVIRLIDEKPLNLGHLSDVHINVRHNALAKSPAKVIEDSKFEQRAVGARVCNSFNALKELFDRIGTGKPDTALLFTGDLIDFNRNIDRRQVGDGIGEQWKKFNVLNNINTPTLYPRGQDDMLAFSLVRYAYNTLKMPVFMTSGNHEAYSVPYGISPRINAWAGAMGVLEDTTDTLGKRWGREREYMPTSTVRAGKGGVRTASNIGGMAEAGRWLVSRAKNVQIDDLDATYRDFDKASEWHDNKANEGIAADHNMTVFEATLAYGPTYAQALTGNNYDAGNYDWFYTLFTPLEDVVIALGLEPDTAGAPVQVLAALGWGQGENFKNVVSGKVGGVDQQSTGILPRATRSFSTQQLGLLRQAQAHKAASGKASLVVASHFTIINYGESVAYSAAAEDVRFVPPAGTGNPVGRHGFNNVNTGTCEINQDRYFAAFVRTKGAGSGPYVSVASADTCVDWHLSGHSHRSGVYEASSSVLGTGVRQIQVESAKDPGIQGKQTAPARQYTRFIVSSSGGPIGKQNLDHELDGWTLRPPSGTKLELQSGNIDQVKTLRSSPSAGQPFNEKPRLAVALDYMTVMSRTPSKKLATPLAFEPALLGEWGGQMPIKLSRTMTRLNCIAGLKIWVFEQSGKGARAIKQWTALEPKFNANAGSPSMTLTREHVGTLLAAIDANSGNDGSQNRGKGLAQAFFEVQLKQPTVGLDDWSEDMDCTDSWIFALHVWVDSSNTGPRTWHFMRPPGEKGEVPDWDFLANNYADRGYISKEDAIGVKKK